MNAAHFIVAVLQSKSAYQKGKASQFIDMHKGTVSASSKGRGRGTTFVIELPYGTNTFKPGAVS